MRYSTIVASMMAMTVATTTQAQDAAAPIQSLYVPLPEESLYNDVFHKIRDTAKPPITSMISISISTDNTIIYYDHWEDGYDDDVTGSKQTSTEVWGDGDPKNGCAPMVDGTGKKIACDENNPDILLAGDVSILESVVTLNGSGNTRTRDSDDIVFDGGDLIQATLPVAVTRAAYPSSPGSLMAGAVEVIEQANWGKSFEAPVGTDVSHSTSAYQLSRIAVMAGTDNTDIYYKGNKVSTLNRGESRIISVEQSDTITASEPIQAHLITGDIQSSYELRWYYLAPTEQWYTEAYAPVGDSLGKVRVTVYNPSNQDIKCTMTTNSGTETLTVAPKKHTVFPVIHDGDAAKFQSDSQFYAFSSTDTAYRNGDGTKTYGQIYDWGYPLVGKEQLTNQVIIGLGYGCTENSCDSKGERSIVWVTPVEDATIHIDYNNDGVVDKKVTAFALQSIEFTDDNDEDMSGANIYATDANGQGVKIAAAWGQKAANSFSGDSDGMDLGTVVVPFEGTRTSCSVSLINDNDNNNKISVGDLVEQMIKVVNVGQLNVVGNTLAVETPGGYVQVEPLESRGDTQIYTVQYPVPEGYDVLPNCDLVPYEPVTRNREVVPSPKPTDPPATAPPTDPPVKPTDPPATAPPTDPPVRPTDPPVTNPPAKPTDPPATPPPKPAPKASSSGDPHFKTWTGEKFDYHGECDLVLLDNPSFNNGQGMRVHIRTTRVKYFSFIEKVAIQIGDETLEFDNDAENFLINGEKVGENKVHHKTMLAGFVVRRDARAISIRLHDEGTVSRHNNNVAKIDLHTRKNGFPAVIVDAGHTDLFKGSLGLLGEWGTGRKLARDGATEIEVDPENASDFALEWQVRDTEAMLFKESRFPMFPATCIPPKKMLGGRLGMEMAKKEAEEACSHWKYDKEDCIFDVIATRDILVAQEGHIVHIE